MAIVLSNVEVEIIIKVLRRFRESSALDSASLVFIGREGNQMAGQVKADLHMLAAQAWVVEKRLSAINNLSLAQPETQVLPEKKEDKVTTKYFVIGDIGAHDGFVTSEEMDHIWSSDNEGGWTYQELTGAHGTILGEFDTQAEAQDHLSEWLKCDAPETGRYCYTHNPNPQDR